MNRLACVALLAAIGSAGCQGATAFGDSSVRRDAGAERATPLPAAEALPAPPPPLPPPLPRNGRLTCRVDADCALVERPCTCPPCGDVWKEVLNRRAVDKLKSQWARRHCRQ